MALATAAACAAGIAAVGAGGAGGEVTASAGTGWSILPSSPLTRTEGAAARIGGKVYVVGGFIPPGAPPPRGAARPPSVAALRVEGVAAALKALGLAKADA